MRKFSVRPTLSLKGRTFKGLRGWSGKPTHPPLTDFPIVAYLFAAAFDIIASLGRHESWARDFFRAGTFVIIAGAAVSVLAALTGFWDWLRSTESGTQARRTANTHGLIMLTVTVARARRYRAAAERVRLALASDDRDPRVVDRRRRARVARRDVRRHVGVRLRLQRRDRRRQSRVARVRDGRTAREAAGLVARRQLETACGAGGAAFGATARGFFLPPR